MSRSVLNRVHISDHNKIKSTQGRKPDAVIADIGSEILHSEPVISHDVQNGIYYAVNRAVNDISCQKGNAEGIEASILLPPDTEEECLRRITDEIQDACSRLGVEYIGCGVYAADAVIRPVTTVVCVGARKKRSQFTAKPDKCYSVIITNEIALSGTAVAALENEDELRERFYPEIVENAIAFKDRISVSVTAKIFIDDRDVFLLEISEGGVNAALWELSSICKMGIDIDIKSIPIRQETVEICEYFNINPYEMMSDGAMIIVSEDAEAVIDRLEKNEIHAVVVGKLTNSKDKKLRNGDDTGCLNKPVPDSIFEIIKNDRGESHVH